ncbi:MAG: hypothetical protein CL928_08425 [Deltaproteobacteria bacterium]|nr:hypothetical protein [Deltaproteobacteria bacterium]
MNVRQLQELLRAMPTMMSALQEGEVLKHLSEMADDELLSDSDPLEYIFGRLYESHTGRRSFKSMTTMFVTFKPVRLA